jgi:hypothetical protein
MFVSSERWQHKPSQVPSVNSCSATLLPPSPRRVVPVSSLGEYEEDTDSSGSSVRRIFDSSTDSVVSYTNLATTI